MKIYKGKIKRRKMHRRIKVCGMMLGMMFLIIGVRLCFLTLDTDSAAIAQESSRYGMDLYTERHTIYDRDFLPLTKGEEYYICVSPTPQSYTTLSTFLGGESLDAALGKIRESKPFFIRSDEALTGAGLTVISRKKRYGIADHIIGYVDSTGHGVAGIEQDFDSLLYTGQAAAVHYTADARGGILSGYAPTVEVPDIGADGVVLTLDREIQLICEEAMSGMEAGAAVVMDVESGDLLAMVSRPDFDAESLSVSLNKDNSPLIDRCLTNYNVGSVFKPLFAAAALENGFDETFTVNCNGSLEVDGRTFACHEKAGHGVVNFKTAVAKSCNVFFYTLSTRTDGVNALKIMEKMGFAKETSLTNSILIPAATLPSATDLSAPAAAANFSIGQGDLMLSPVHIAAIYAMLARDGAYIRPRLVKGVFEGGYTPYPENEAIQIISQKSAKKIQTYLAETVKIGSGQSAAPKNTTAAGKTATAETGWIKDNRSINQSWFAGYFPADAPKYVVVILQEDGISGAVDCAPIFKQIAEGIAE